MIDALATGLQSSFVPAPQVLDVLVLGLGNTLLSDDGVGVHVVRQLASDPDMPPGLHPVDGGTLGFRLLATLTQATAVVIVDAAELGEASGTVRMFDQPSLAERVSRGGRMSAHEAGLLDLLTLAHLERWSPARLALLGIQPARIDWGERLSAPVARALPLACRAIVQTALSWQAA
jgi:hydrogenase maturation protease